MIVSKNCHILNPPTPVLMYYMNGPIAPLERRSLQFSSSYHDWFMPPFAAWLAVVSEQVSSY